jgi:hypothetical protein
MKYISTTSLNIISFFTTDKHPSYEKNKIDHIFEGILPNGWRLPIKPERLDIGVLFLE